MVLGRNCQQEDGEQVRKVEAEGKRQLSALYLLDFGKLKKISSLLFFMRKRRVLGNEGNRTWFCGVSHPLLVNRWE